MLPNEVVLFGPVPGGMEMVVILLIAVLLFGANKIPKLARSTGEAMGEFQKGRQEVEKELEEMQDATSVDAESSDSEDSLNLDSEDSSGGSSSP
jgi:sec-independent protein translocase protein TatA